MVNKTRFKSQLKQKQRVIDPVHPLNTIVRIYNPWNIYLGGLRAVIIATYLLQK